ncbi:MAG: dihydropteroate synthase [Thermoleophilia bacterium]|nr:dihydropteroate synthase [Thermoleophilia bacterium]
MIIIGERINTSIGYILAAYEQGQSEVIAREARLQWEAGAQYIDINAGLKLTNNEAWLSWAVDVVQESLPDARLSIDTTRPAVMAAVFKRLHETKDVILNSITCQKHRIEGMLPIVKEYGCKLIALTIDEKGMPDTAEGRYDIAARLAEVAGTWGIPLGDVYIDFLALPIRYGHHQAQVSLDTLAAIKARIPEINTVVNVSAATWHLPNRSYCTGVLQAMLTARGIDAVILNVLDQEVMDAVVSAGTLLGNDPDCATYLQRFEASRASEPIVS